MTTADWALVVSIFSFVVSLGSFVWNIWSKFIYPRAKVRARISVMLSFDADRKFSRNFISLSATNYGPTDITLHSHIAKARQGFLWFGRNRRHAMINPVAHPDSDEPTGFFAPGFPKKLAVGESVSVYFSPLAPKRWVDEMDLYYFGFTDTFGRYHWCSLSNAKKFRKDLIEDFDAVPPAKRNILHQWQAALGRLWVRFTGPLSRRLQRKS